MHEVVGKVPLQDIIEMTFAVTECKAAVQMIQPQFIILNF